MTDEQVIGINSSINAGISWFHIVPRVDDHHSVGNFNTLPPALFRYRPIDDLVTPNCGLSSSKLFSCRSVVMEQLASGIKGYITDIWTVLQPAMDGDVLYAQTPAARNFPVDGEAANLLPTC